MLLTMFILSHYLPPSIIEPDLLPAGAGVGGWSMGDRCTSADKISVDILLRHNELRLQHAEAQLISQSDPTSTAYGQHLGQDAITELFEMTSEATAVVDWLLTEGVPAAVGLNRDSVTLKSVACPAVERLFGTPIHHYAHPKQGVRTILRARAALTMPAALAPLVATVAPLARLPSVRLPKLVPDADSFLEEAIDTSTWDGGCGTGFLGCGSKVTPKILAQRYQLGNAPSGPAKGSMAVAEFQGVFWDQKGLDAFSSACHLPNMTVDKQIGPDRPARCLIPIIGSLLCSEAMLDIEYIKAVGGSVPLTDVFQSDYSLEKLAQTLLAMPDGDLPKVLSVSYGNDEAQQPNTPSFMRACDAAFMKLGLRGVSVLVASGDQGVWGREGFPVGSKKFHPDYPASSPYVTAVGGTDFAQYSVVGDEKAWRDGGGGFSDTFPRPAYQQAAVASYLASNTSMPDASLFNSSGRAYPDVSALGGEQNPYCVSTAKLLTGVAGTSASTPVFAGIVAKINELRLASGKPTLGFLNPFLYQNPGALNDVTLGENKGDFKVGFKAAPGWDPATGLGTPNFQKLAKAAMAATS